MSNDLGPIKHIYLNKDNLDEVLGAFIMTEHGPKSVPVFPGEESGFGNVDVKYVSPDADVAKLFEKRFSQCGAKSNVPSWIGKVFGKAKEIISDVVEVIGGAAKAVAEAVDTTVEVVVQALETGGQECFAMLDETVKVSGDAQLEIIDQGLELFVEGANTPEVVLLDPQVLPVDISVPMSGDISEAMISSMLISDTSGNSESVGGGLPQMTMAKAMTVPGDNSSIGNDQGYVYDDGLIANAMAYGNLQNSGSEGDVSPDTVHDGIDGQFGGQAMSAGESRRAAKQKMAEKDLLAASRRNSESAKESPFARRSIEAAEAGQTREQAVSHTSQVTTSGNSVVQASGKKPENESGKKVRLSDPDLIGDPNDQLVSAHANGGKGGAGAAMAAGSIRQTSGGATAADFVASLDEGSRPRVGLMHNQGENHGGNQPEHENKNTEENDQNAGSAPA